MYIRHIASIEEWEAFLKAEEFTPFVQSSRYGDFYRALGEESWLFGVYSDANVLIGGSLVVSTHAKRGRFLYVPYGPVLAKGAPPEAFEVLIHHIATFAKSEEYDFLRLSPFLDDTPENRELLRRSLCRPSPLHVLAETTWMLDLTPGVETIFGAMNKNHRNLIRRAEKEGVRVEIRRDKEAVALFNDMLDTTTRRHKFVRFPRSYVEQEFKAFEPHDEAVVYLAYLPDGRLDAAAIVMYYGSMAAYRHGASFGYEKRLPSSYLIQWTAIQEAKRRGMKYYNFWGIAPVRSKKTHPFFGITHFKTGFGGVQKDLIHCHDRPLSWRYTITWCIETLRRYRRGF